MNHVRRYAAAVSTAACVLLGTTAPAAASPPPPPAVAADAPALADGRIVVAWRSGTPASERAAVRARHGLRHDERVGPLGADVVGLPPASVARTLEALRAEPSVAYAEEDVVVQAADDPGYAQQWGLHNIGQEGGAPDVDIDAPEAWATTQGRADVVVAVIDTGVDVTHPDLRDNIWRNAGEIPGNRIDDDRNGYVDDVNGWDFLGDDATVFDDPVADRHGTHVAGTIAAARGNGLGVVGVAPSVKIMPIKFLGADGSGTASDAAAAFAYARDNGARLVNASWGGDASATLKAVIAAATDLAVFAASGNKGHDVDATGTMQFPAGWADDAHGMPHVVSVTSVGRWGTRSAFANHGSRSVDVGAPGEQIVSTMPGGGYASMSGTSMAAPHASGTAALLASVDSSARGKVLADAVKAGAQPLAALRGATTTGGLVNAAATLQLRGSAPVGTQPPTAPTTSPTPTSPGTATQPAPAPAPAPPSAPQPYDGEGVRSLDWACPDVVATRFVDVAPGSTHAAGIACAEAWEVFTGASDGRFEPSTVLTRGQLASVLARAIEGVSGEPLPSSKDHFVDDDASVHRSAIDRLATLGIVTGVDATHYRPAAPVTRAQFASMLARASRHLGADLPAGRDAFVDDDGSVHEAAIDALVGLGVLGGTSSGRFEPAVALNRAQAATMVARLLDALVEAGVASPEQEPSPAT